MKNKIGQIALILAVLQVLLVLVSWLVTAAYPDLSIRSLLSGEGTRWFFSHFIDNLTTKFLVWILLGTIAYGALTTSGLLGVIFKSAKLYFHFGKLYYRERIGLRMVLIELFIFIIIAVMLTAFPQAVLLSITGSLFPSSFSEGLYPYVTFAMIVCGLTYGVAAGHIKTTVQAYDTLSSGLVICAKLFPLYILVVSLKVCNSSFLSLYFHCYFILFFPVFELIYSPFICRLCFLHRHGCQEEDDRLL